MIGKELLRLLLVQLVGQGIMAVIGWYWFSLGVGTTGMVAANGLLLLVMWAGWSVLDAYGLGQVRNWTWALLAVALTPLMLLHVVAVMLVPILWLLVLLPSAAIGRWVVLLKPGYWAVSLAILLAMLVVPAALLNWVPGIDGLTGQAISFGARSLLAYTVFVGGWTLLLWHIGRNARQTV